MVFVMIRLLYITSTSTQHTQNQPRYFLSLFYNVTRLVCIPPPYIWEMSMYYKTTAYGGGGGGMVVGGTEQPDNVSIWNTDTGITITKQDIIMLLQHLFQKRSTCIFHHLLLLLLSISLTLTPSISLHTQKKNSYTLHTTPHILYFYRYVLRACVCSSAPTFPSNKLVK